MPADSPSAVKIFFSYAHEDERLCKELVKRLAVMKDQGWIEAWDDRQISPGENWAEQIDTRLDDAHIILLLVSPDFLASEYCNGVEVRRALERHESEGERCVVIPVILRTISEWRYASFSKLQALPRDAKAVTSWADEDEAFDDVAAGIRRAVEKLRGGSGDDEAEARAEGAREGEARRERRRIPVPWLLPYLCDRSEQEIALGHALDEHQDNAPRRPFVCVVHGDQEECHSEFLDRLHQESLPKILGLEKRDCSIDDRRLDWPPSVNRDNAARSFMGVLALKLRGTSRDATPENMFEEVPPQVPLMLTLSLNTEDLKGTGTDALDYFFDFWNGWPDLPVGRTLIVVLSVRHQPPKKRGMFDTLNFFRKAAGEPRDYFERLDFSKYGRLHGVVLPELRAISHGDVLRWSERSEVREHCDIRAKHVKQLFARREILNAHGQIPMERLADELTALIEQHRR